MISTLQTHSVVFCTVTMVDLYLTQIPVVFCTVTMVDLYLTQIPVVFCTDCNKGFVKIISLFPMHRWLLLDFKREFPFEEALRIFEVLNSQYLELNSDRALVVTDKVIAKEFEMDGELV